MVTDTRGSGELQRTVLVLIPAACSSHFRPVVMSLQHQIFRFSLVLVLLEAQSRFSYFHMMHLSILKPRGEAD